MAQQLDDPGGAGFTEQVVEEIPARHRALVVAEGSGQPLANRVVIVSLAGSERATRSPSCLEGTP